jgi:hypothetical protein
MQKELVLPSSFIVLNHPHDLEKIQLYTFVLQI